MSESRPTPVTPWSRLLPWGHACASGLVVLLAVVALLRGPLDGLSASFLLLFPLSRAVGEWLGGSSAAASTPAPRLSPVAREGQFFAWLLGGALALLAPNAVLLAAGLLLLGLGTSLRTVALSAACLIVALSLAAPLGDFAAIRVAPPEAGRAAAVLLLALLGSALLARLSGVLALYVLVRILSDLCGPTQPLWWGALLLALGAVLAVAGPIRAACAETVHDVVGAAPLQLLGMAVASFGLALLARAADLPAVTGLALEATWLAVVGHALCRTLLLTCAELVEDGAGSRRLDCLGGLVHHMPLTAGCCAAGLLAVAILPPGLGFAAFWLLFQSLLAAARIGGLGLQLLIGLAAALIAGSTALSALAAVRLFGVAFLGRPRTPRAAVAAERSRQLRLTLLPLAVLPSVLGLMPTLALLPAWGWIRPEQSGLMLRTGPESPGYLPLALAALVALAAAAIYQASSRFGERRREAAWSDGFAAPPPWLPFGDPATQFGPASFTRPLLRFTGRLRSAAGLRHRLAPATHMARRVLLALVPP